MSRKPTCRLAPGLYRAAASLSGLTLASCWIVPALPQTLNSGVSIGPSSQVSTPLVPANEPPLPTPEALAVNPLGLRRYLADHGVALLFDTINEYTGNISGGGGPAPTGTQTRGGSDVAGQVGFETDVDWERLAGLQGFSTHLLVLSRYGGQPASLKIGDNLNPNPEIYGAGGNVVAHLAYAYGEETFADGRVDVTAGRIPLLNDFSSSPLYCNYMNNTLCGNPRGDTENVYHSAAPDANWAFRVRVRPLTDYYVQTGVFFSESGIYTDKYDRSGWKFDASDISGEAFPVEVGWEPSVGSRHMPGHYKLGFVYDNNRHADDYTDARGAPAALSGLPARQRTGSTSSYLLADQMVVRSGPGANDGLVLLGGFYNNDPETSVRAYQVLAGAVARHFWSNRPSDGIAFLLSYTRISGRLGKAQALDQELGAPLLANGATGIQTYSEVFELNYQIHAYRGVEVAPDFQYFFRPNAQANLPDAAFLGVKTHIEFF